MSRGGKRGAQPGVLRAMGADDAPQSPVRAEVALCPICGEALDFDLGQYGETLEFCTNRQCANRFPHRPVPQLGRPSDPKKLPWPRYT